MVGVVRSNEPMRLLVVGDFSGKDAADRAVLATRRTQHIDVDNFDDVMRRLEPRANLAGGIAFHRIEDFHPDSLYSRLDMFRALREVRAARPADVDDMLGRLLGKPGAPSPAAGAHPLSGLDAMIRDIVAPHVVKDPSATTAHVAAVDAALAAQMRALLHDPAFQSLEAVWRGMRWLTSSLELDENLQVHLFDVARDELLADIVSAQGKVPQTGFYRAVVDRMRNAAGEGGWSAIVALFHFGPSGADIGLLAALGLVAAQARATLIAGADLALAGGDVAQLGGWQALRRSEAARWIGLAAPRVLLRLPYGKATDPVEAFAFEEFVGLPAHDEFLWGNAAIAIALLLGRAFTARGWEMEPGDEREIGDLPAYTFVRDGEREMQPCAERFLSEAEADRLIECGIMPVASRRDRNAVVALRFQSVSNPAAPLAW